MRTYEYVNGLGVVPAGHRVRVEGALARAQAAAPKAEGTPRKTVVALYDPRWASRPLFEAKTIVDEYWASGLRGAELAKRLRRRAGVLRANEPDLARELEFIAEQAPRVGSTRDPDPDDPRFQ